MLTMTVLGSAGKNTHCLHLHRLSISYELMQRADKAEQDHLGQQAHPAKSAPVPLLKGDLRTDGACLTVASMEPSSS